MTQTERAALEVLIAWRKANTLAALLVESDNLLKMADQIIAERAATKAMIKKASEETQ